MPGYVQENRPFVVMPGMFYAKLLIVAGLVLLVIGLMTRPKKDQVKNWRLLRDNPTDLEDTTYHPKEWRKPKKR